MRGDLRERGRGAGAGLHIGGIDPGHGHPDADLAGAGRGHVIVADGMAGGDFAVGDPEEIARAVLNATSRFHDPMHAAEWRSPEVDAESGAVVSLVLDGIRAR